MLKKTMYLLVTLVIMIPVADAQDKKPLSPEATVTGKLGAAELKIVYCQPSARGRKMLGGIEPYGKVWRTGANAATTFETSKDVAIEGKNLPAGKYELFTIPGEKEWAIIFQKYGKQWGAFGYKEDNDVLRVTVPAGTTTSFVETFAVDIADNKVVLKWENTQVAFSGK